MAILKHISVKNSDYSAAVRYFIFEHDEHGRLVRSENGQVIRRENVLIDSVNCGVLTYDIDCYKENSRYGKNYGKDEIKSHHFILSFDPKDYESGLLTVEKAQELGMGFARKYFAGHQVIVSTHGDGHNGSRNIHVHFSVNSLRIHDIERPIYSEKVRDSKAGYKLHVTDKMMRYLKAQVMELCEKNQLHQVDLLHPAKEKITDREYRARQRGQERLDRENQQLTSEGKPPKQTKFQTELEKIREAIDDAKRHSRNIEDFKKILRQHRTKIVQFGV